MCQSRISFQSDSSDLVGICTTIVALGYFSIKSKTIPVSRCWTLISSAYFNYSGDSLASRHTFTENYLLFYIIISNFGIFVKKFLMALSIPADGMFRRRRAKQFMRTLKEGQAMLTPLIYSIRPACSPSGQPSCPRGRP